MIRILTDSACDILPAEAQQLGVTVIPLNVTLEDGTVLRDGIDMTPSEYYTHLAACRKLPTTSQPSPEQFERLYLDAAAAGDEVLGISGRGCCCTVQTICWYWRWDERMGYMTDFELMGLALEEAAKAAALGEVPVGAVVARHGEVVATAHNTRETEKNALHHAELLAIDAACKALGGWRLWECELFVTLEPCPMCAGGIINSRLRRVVYGAADTKAGCCGSVTDLFALPFNHHPVVEKGLREAEAQQLLQAFFVSLREKRAGRPRWKPPVPENRGK